MRHYLGEGPDQRPDLGLIQRPGLVRCPDQAAGRVQGREDGMGHGRNPAKKPEQGQGRLHDRGANPVFLRYKGCRVEVRSQIENKK